jgi:photosystem II stability/assembly factor-like uncharacterized protein
MVVATAPDPVPDGAVVTTRIMFAVSMPTGWWQPGYATLFTTTDGGLNWSRLVET